SASRSSAAPAPSPSDPAAAPPRPSAPRSAPAAPPPATAPRSAAKSSGNSRSFSGNTSSQRLSTRPPTSLSIRTSPDRPKTPHFQAKSQDRVGQQRPRRATTVAPRNPRRSPKIELLPQTAATACG